MTENDRWVELRCPECDRLIVTAPKDNMPEGELVCPGCGHKTEAPGPLGRWVAEARHKARNLLDQIAPKGGRRR